jgi:CheY-like chemotaxis protein
MEGTILIVEDDVFTQELYKFFFQRKGYKYIITDDAEKFFSILEQNNVSLVILDINLKNTYLEDEKIDGIILAERLRANEKYSKIPIIVVSAYQSNMNGRNLIKDGLVDDFILKPIVDFNELIGKVNKYAN